MIEEVDSKYERELWGETVSGEHDKGLLCS
jgi:hypothetical protein